MFSPTRARIQSIFWLCVPTLIWSLFVQTIIICIDPLLLPATEKRLPPKISMLCRWLWVVLFFVTVLDTWNIAPGTYLFYLREALPFTPKFVLWELAISAALLTWFAVRRHGYERLGIAKSKLFLLGVGLLMMKAALVADTFHSPFLRQHLGSPLRAGVQMMFNSIKSKNASVAIETPGLTFDAYVRQQAVMPPRVVLMVVESWGETPSTIASIAGEITKQGFDVKKYGFTAYRGSTLSGEFRELCSAYVQPSGELADAGMQLNCAPKFLNNKQYDVIGIHGYRRLFYARSTFWSRFGVKKQIFKEDLSGMPDCPGSFPAVCDESLIRYGVGMLDNADKPLFLYMLTVSSHEPVERTALDRHGKYFNDIEVVHATQVISRRAISELIDRLKARQHHDCTLIYIAGDHQPPSASVKGNIFEPGKVPYLAFADHCPAS